MPADGLKTVDIPIPPMSKNKSTQNQQIHANPTFNFRGKAPLVKETQTNAINHNQLYRTVKERPLGCQGGLPISAV